MSDVFNKFLAFLNRLDESGLAYTLEHNRDEAIMVCVSKDSERWEIEYLADGEVEVEVFYSDLEEDDLEDEESLERLFEEEELEDEELEDDELEDEDD